MFFEIQTFVNLDETAHMLITFVFTIMQNVTSLINWNTFTIPAGEAVPWIALKKKSLFGVGHWLLKVTLVLSVKLWPKPS